MSQFAPFLRTRQSSRAGSFDPQPGDASTLAWLKAHRRVGTPVLLVGSLAACAPPAETGQCDSDLDCPVRGQVCDTVVHECVPDDIDYDTTQIESEANFTDKVLPFFRGRVCTVADEFQAGASLPIRMEPCIHPCITASNGGAHVFHLRECRGGVCDGFSVEWFDATGVDCPADVFARFDPALCQYPVALAGRYPPFEAGGSPIVGRFRLEVPFLTNNDAAAIANYSSAMASETCNDDCLGAENPESCLRACFIREHAEAYVQQADRVMSFEMLADAPAPPPDCDKGQADCGCVDIGF